VNAFTNKMLQKFLNHVRSKSKATRDRYAMLIALSFTAVVAGAWLLTGSSITNSKELTAGANEHNAPFSQLFRQIKEQFGEVKEKISEMSTSTEAVGEDDASSGTNDSFNMELTPETVASSTAKMQASSTQNKPNNPQSDVDYVEIRIATTSREQSTTTSSE
jgi:hypothetical protein